VGENGLADLGRLKRNGLKDLWRIHPTWFDLVDTWAAFSTEFLRAFLGHGGNDAQPMGCSSGKCQAISHLDHFRSMFWRFWKGQNLWYHLLLYFTTIFGGITIH
jgi:hypothetical protein